MNSTAPTAVAPAPSPHDLKARIWQAAVDLPDDEESLQEVLAFLLRITQAA